ncbi:hypothetical protein DdX_09615 [Ditylenchus destructor]|uniref:SKP1 component POZ domain-containing protein n=1 Tax=Ditylenchus destructor TaxID=166010 RepID=A0AAD4R004_9BILA|nr:hypothetical protein DdX_09615 [Ditylenchus destructor]
MFKRTGDGVLFEVPLNVISQAGTFAQMYSDLQLGAESAAPFGFPMPAVSAKVFEQLVEFCEQRIAQNRDFFLFEIVVHL